MRAGLQGQGALPWCDSMAALQLGAGAVSQDVAWFTETEATSLASGPLRRIGAGTTLG